jgi:hypothetical protein
VRAAKFLGIPYHEFLELPDKHYLMHIAAACSHVENKAEEYHVRQAQKRAGG